MPLESGASGMSVVSSRPSFTVDGMEAGGLQLDLVSMEATQDEDGMATLTVVLKNWGKASPTSEADFRYFDGKTLDLGRSIQVTAGDDDNKNVVFDGLITAIEGVFPEHRSAEVIVRAEDQMQKLRMRQRTRLHEELNDADIAKDVVEDAGLSADTDGDGPTHVELWQINQSELGFLRERARAVDARLVLEEGSVKFAPRRPAEGEPITVSGKDELLRFRVSADLAHQRTKVRVHGYDVQGKEAIHEEGGAELLTAEGGGGRTGPMLLETAGIEAIEDLHLEAPATSEEAKKLAESTLLARGRRFVFGRGVTDGTPSLSAPGTLILEDIGDWFSGRYHVTSVRHTFDTQEGYRTHFAAERVDIGLGGGI